MKAFAVAAGLALVAGTASADPVEGVWQTRKDDNGDYGFVEIRPCCPVFCGVLVKAFDAAAKARPSGNIGRRIVWDMVAYPGGLYDDGKIWSPDRDKTYNGDMTLAGDSLQVRGCVLGICRDGGTCVRVK